MDDITVVTVRWLDGCLEEFHATKVRFDGAFLFIRLTNGQNLHIPKQQVCWFGLSKESNQRMV